MTDIEIVLRYITSLNDWIDGGQIININFNYDGKDYFIGYRGNRNVRELAPGMGDLDDFIYNGLYNGISYRIYGRKRLTEGGKKVRQYKVEILNDNKVEIKTEIKQGQSQLFQTNRFHYN